MRFLADESVELVVVVLLRSEGHDVLYVAEGSPGIDDDRVLAAASGGERIRPQCQG